MSYYPGSPGYPPAYPGGASHGPRPAASNASFYWKVAGIGLGIGLLLCVILVAVVLALFGDKLFRARGSSSATLATELAQNKLVGDWEGTSNRTQMGTVRLRLKFKADQSMEMEVSPTLFPNNAVTRRGQWRVTETGGATFARVEVTFSDGLPGPSRAEMRITFRGKDQITDGPDYYTRVGSLFGDTN